jgi:CMP-N-acetylneuraminic acid synthetase
VIGLVPARGGSKGIPRKNLAPLGGRPLLAHTLEAARASSSLTRVVVSTDSEETAAVARGLGAETLARPPELAADETPMLDVVRHALGELDPCDVLVVLQPTSPLRRAVHIDESVTLLVDSGADCVVSVVAVPHQFAPDSLMLLEGDRLTPVTPQAPLLRQSKAQLYARNGPAVLALRPDRLGEGGFYAGDVRAYVMDERSSIDVDTELDLEVVECLLGGDERAG